MLFLLTLLACQDNGITVHNADPEVSISAPFEGAILPAEVPVTFVARPADDSTPLEELQVQWTSDLDGMLSGSVEFGDGEATTVVGEGISVGDHLLTVTVFDDQGANSSATVRVLASPNDPPSVQILSPEQGGSFEPDTALQLVAYLEDDFDAPEDLTLGLTSSVSGSVPFTSAMSGGTATLQIPDGLSADDQTLTLEAFDTGGAHADASVDLAVGRNAQPVVTLLSPTAEEVYEPPHFWVEVQIQDEGTLDYSDHELIWTGLVDSPYLDITSHLPAHPALDGSIETYVEFTCEASATPNAFVFGVIVTDPGMARGSAEAEIQLRCTAG